ncbi:MAG: hypothetical protein IKO44_00800 [Ruminococcus sp.]|nr:hypothetical protein [Ruminococcus sp.]
MSLYNYSQGTDLPPGLGAALSGNAEAASFFTSLSSEQQQAVITNSGQLRSKADLDEFIKQSDNAMFSDICCSEFSDIGRKPL